MTAVEVLRPGAFTTIQDLGRPGHAHIGVPRSGAADRKALRLANRLVCNDASAAALETTLVGPRLLFHRRALVALTGAPVSSRPMNEPFEMEEGAVLEVGTAHRGLRTYIAFAGGIRAPLTLGSAATDVLTGLGPAPLARGDLLKIGERGAKPTPWCGFGPSLPQKERPQALRGPDGTAVLRVISGPRADWFAPAAVTQLSRGSFKVSPQSNRIGVRLDGPELVRSRPGELPSEGLVPGSLQVPGDGRPILLLADHPTTGGYPVIAVVHSDDLCLAAQLRPGERVRFLAVRGTR